MAGANAAGLYFEDHIIIGPPDAWHSMTEHGQIVPAYPRGAQTIAKSRPPAKIRPSSVLYRSEEHTSELQSLMRISYAVFCLKKKKKKRHNHSTRTNKYQ